MSERIPPDIAQQAADVAALGLPLIEGLRAATEEMGATQKRRLEDLARRIEKGQSLDDILAGVQDNYSRFTLQSLRSAIERGDPARVVVDLGAYEISRRRMSASLWSALAYPLGLLMLMFVVFTVLIVCLFPSIAQILEEFDLDSVDFSGIDFVAAHGWKFAVGILLGMVGISLVCRIYLGRPRWKWLLYSLPIAGPILLWSAAWEFAIRLRILLEHRTSLPEALEIVGKSVSDANFADVAKRLGQSVRAGQTLSETLEGTSRIPATLIELIRWGEENNKLVDSLRLAEDAFQQRLEIRQEFLRGVLPPVVYVVIAAVAISGAAILIGPLLVLVQMMVGRVGVGGGGIMPGLPGLGYIGLSLFGFALWWTMQLLFAHRPGVPDSYLVFIVRLAAVIMIVFGTANVLLSTGIITTLIGLTALGILWCMAVNRYRRSEVRSLLLQLSLAREHGLPIIDAAKAFAAERTDDVGLRAAKLVEHLQAGSPFQDAMRRARIPSTTETLFAAKYGMGRADAVQAMGAAARRSLAPAELTIGVIQRLLYLCFLPLFGILVWSFVYFRIIPTIEDIFDGFGLPLPAVTELAIDVTMGLTGNATLAFVLASLAVLALSLCIFLLLLYYTGWLRWEPHFIRGFTARYHGSIVLRTLAAAVDGKRDIAEALTDIAVAYPTRYVKRRLCRAVEQIEEGQSWISALVHQRLVTKASAAVLSSAQRANNLSWAMREMADAAVRRLLLRLKAFSELATPLFLVVLAIPLGFIAVSVFMPMIKLIEALV